MVMHPVVRSAQTCAQRTIGHQLKPKKLICFEQRSLRPLQPAVGWQCPLAKGERTKAVSSVVSGRAADRGGCWRGHRCLARFRGSWRSWSASRRSSEAAGARQPLRRPRCRPRHRRHHRRPPPPAPNAAPLPRRPHAARRRGHIKEAAHRLRPRPRKRGVGATALGI
eukprot:COSAG01_NODE_17855_length_1119_cov_1.432353_1_plen_167_part_00